MRLVVIALLVAASLAGCSKDAPTTDVPEPQAGTGAVRGVVVDTSITPIADVQVTLRATGASASTDAEGMFEFLDVEPGSHFLDFEKAGYESAQAGTQVVADVAEPELLQVQMVAAPSQLPLAVPSTHTGFIACEALVGTFLESCDAGTGLFGEPDNEIFLGAEDRAPDHVQAEVVWEHTQEFGARLTMTIGSCNGGAYCAPFGGNLLCQNWGPSPLWCRVGQEGITASGFYNGGQTLNQTGHGRNQEGVGIGMHLGADCSACADPVAPAAGVGIILQQEVHTYLWSFYNMAPEEGWVFSKDGDP